MKGDKGSEKGRRVTIDRWDTLLRSSRKIGIHVNDTGTGERKEYIIGRIEWRVIELLLPSLDTDGQLRKIDRPRNEIMKPLLSTDKC